MTFIKHPAFKILMLAASTLVFSISAHAIATVGDIPIAVKGGTLACTGSQKNIADKTHYRLVNFNDNATITIQRLRVYDPSGALRLDYPAVDALPANFKTTIAPHQISVFQSEAAFGNTLLGPVQLIIDFKSDKAGYALHGLTSRILLDPDTSKESSRSDEGCSYLHLRK